MVWGLCGGGSVSVLVLEVFFVRWWCCVVVVRCSDVGGVPSCHGTTLLLLVF